MSKRPDQVYKALIKQFVDKHGRMPTDGELHEFIRGQFYVPMTKPVVPKDHAVSNPDYFRSTVQGLIDDGYDIMDLIKDQLDQVKQLRTAMQARKKESEDNIRDSTNTVRLQETLESSRAAVVSALPNPLNRLSDHVTRAGGAITLESDSSYPIGYSIIDVVPFADKKVQRSLLGDFSLPYTAIVDSGAESTYSGIQIQMLLEEPSFITRIHYEGSGCFVTVEVLNNKEGTWSQVVSRSLSGQDDLAIAEQAVRLRLTLTQNLSRSAINITDLRLFQERYHSQGIYTSSPIKLDGYGSLEFSIDQHVPENTEVAWEYAVDEYISGDYVDSYGNSVPLDSPAFGSSTYNAIAESQLTFANIAGYDLNERFQSPRWKDHEPDIRYNIESGNYPSYLGDRVVANNASSAVIDLAAIDSSAVDGMVNVTYGKDAWIFRVGTLERAVIDESGLRRLAMTGYPHWFTHLLVENSFELSIDDPFERINYVLLELNGHVLVLKRPFTYVLAKGIWKCTLVIDDEYVQTQNPMSPTIRAVEYSGINPVSAINTVDRNGSTLKFYIHPFPVPIVSEQRIFTDPDYTDFQRAAISKRVGEKHVLVPDMSIDPSSVDFVSTTFEITTREDIYVSTNASSFFDITYLQEIATPIEYLFVRAKLSTTNKTLTPVIRGVSVALNDTKREPPQQIKRLRDEGSIKPLD